MERGTINQSMNVGFSFQALSWREAVTFIGDELPTDGSSRGEERMVASWGCVLTQLLVYSTIEME